ncbi:MAG: hypothetical protein J6332_06330, partial [Abditibacteriota bacterium]|nr:hypothetical protein [Abditibacteriota bacterium]
IMIYHSNDYSLSIDDMAMLGMCSKGFTFREMIRSAVENDRMPIFYHMFFFLFNKIAVGDLAFKLSSMIFAAAGIFTCGLLGKRLGNTFAGTVTACVAAYQVCSPIGHFLRPYALLFFVMTVVLLLYVKRFEERGNETIKTQIALGILYAVAVNLHYTAIIALFALFAADAIMVAAKRSRPAALISYGICALLFLPWFIFGVVMPAVSGSSHITERAAENLSPYPWKEMARRFGKMKSLTPFAPFAAVYCLILLKKIRKGIDDNDRIVLLLAAMFLLLFTTVTLIGRNPNMYLNVRFYVPALPVLALGCGLLASWAVKTIGAYRSGAIIISIIAIPVCLICVHKSFLPGSRFFMREHKTASYKEVAEYLLTKGDIHDKDVMAVDADGDEMRYLGWHNHYLTKDLTEKEVYVPLRAVPVPENIRKIYYCLNQNISHRDGIEDEREALLEDFNLTSTETVTAKTGIARTIVEEYERRKTD